jgi:hypothetical protein
MSFDLYFHQRSESELVSKDVTNYFRPSPYFNIEINSHGTQYNYRNEATGVYCTFASSARENLPAGADGRWLEFRLSYNRPISFPYETLPIVENFCESFNLLVEDAQQGTVETASTKQLLDSWRMHNVVAVRALAAQGLAQRYLPENKTFEWWRYNRMKKRFERDLQEDIFVPDVFVFQSPDKQLFRFAVFGEGIAQFLPVCDLVWVERRRAQATLDEVQTGLISYDVLIDRLRPYLDQYDVLGETLTYLPATNISRSISLVQKLELLPVDLSTYNQVAPDDFHNVELNSRVAF